MDESKNEKKRESIHDIGKNCIYIFKEAFSACKVFFLIYIFIIALIDAIDSVLIIVLYKYLLDCVNKQRVFSEIVVTLIVLGGGCGLFTIVIRAILGRFYDIKILQVNRLVNTKLFKKNLTMDISNYDDEDYYNKYVLAMENGDAQMSATIKAGAGIVSMLLSITSLSGILLLIDPSMFLFPLLACLIHMITGLYMTRIRYELQKDVTPLTRKKNYCRRVFYQPEFSKEVRLTDIFEAHSIFYTETVEKETECERKYGKKLRLVKTFNSIVGWVLLVYYLPMQHLIYNSVVTAKMGLGDVAAVNESNQSLTNSIDSLTTNMVGLQEIGLFGSCYRKFMENDGRIESRKGIVIEDNAPKTIEFKDVSFSYDGSDDYVLKNINIKIKPGQKIAIVGYNGSGKSTFIKLLLNLYTVTKGNILYDGKVIEEYDCKSYRKRFAVLFQDFQTYSLSIKDNVLMGEYDEKDESEALELARINKKIDKLPQKDESTLTQEFDKNGIMLSGGENQRLALSRLYMGNNPIVILDEHTSAMDPMTEKEVNDTIFTHFKDHTIIYISHHLTSVCNADYIYYMEKGRVVESGTHKDLMELNSKYKTMFDFQTSYYTT